MTELLTSNQMQALERSAIDSGFVAGLTLMERAGQGVCDAVFACWPQFDRQPMRAAVFCGPGNNGGDGFVIARLLAARGWIVAVYLFGHSEKQPPDAKINHDRWAADHEVRPWDRAIFQAEECPDLIVDAVFGIGLTRALPSDVTDMLDDTTRAHWPQARNIKVVAVDCPSGLNLDTGQVPGAAARAPKADLTVTFHSPKPGHYLEEGPTLCGTIRVVDIGLEGEAHERCSVMQPPDPERLRLVEPRYRNKPLEHWPVALVAKMRRGGHKYEHGHVVVFAGDVGRGGAGRMAARSALRAGAGLVTLLCPPQALQENAARLDAVMLRALAPEEALTDVADHRVSGFVLGPGMGVSHRTRERVEQALRIRPGGAGCDDPVVVLDADALTSFAEAPQQLFDQTHDRTVLTPHEGEFARLFPDLGQAERGAMSKVQAVRLAARRAGCIVLLKGPDTVIAQPDGGASVHAACYDRDAPWLATAGAGDVLAGLIAGLAAPSAAASLFNMVEVAAWLHVEAARSFGPGLIAEDLPDLIPKVLAGQRG